jgi:hypothetical protein
MRTGFAIEQLDPGSKVVPFGPGSAKLFFAKLASRTPPMGFNKVEKLRDSVLLRDKSVDHSFEVGVATHNLETS